MSQSGDKRPADEAASSAPADASASAVDGEASSEASAEPETAEPSADAEGAGSEPDRANGAGQSAAADGAEHGSGKKKKKKKGEPADPPREQLSEDELRYREVLSFLGSDVKSPVGVPRDYKPQDHSIHPLFRIDIGDYGGPLDLLVYLIRKHEIDVFDIPIRFVTERYLEMLEVLRALDIDVAAEFLVLAADLVHIKSKMLLPAKEGELLDEPIEEAGDPRADLVRRLLEYQKYRDAAAELGDREQLGRDVFARQPPLSEGEEAIDPGLRQISIFKLVELMAGMIKKKPVRHEISYDSFNIAERMHFVLRFGNSRGGRFLLIDLMEQVASRAELVVTFIAVLESTKLQLVRLRMDDASGAARPLWGKEAPAIAAETEAGTSEAPSDVATPPPEAAADERAPGAAMSAPPAGTVQGAAPEAVARDGDGVARDGDGVARDGDGVAPEAVGHDGDGLEAVAHAAAGAETEAVARPVDGPEVVADAAAGAETEPSAADDAPVSPAESDAPEDAASTAPPQSIVFNAVPVEAAIQNPLEDGSMAIPSGDGSRPPAAPAEPADAIAAEVASIAGGPSGPTAAPAADDPSGPTADPEPPPASADHANAAEGTAADEQELHADGQGRQNDEGADAAPAAFDTAGTGAVLARASAPEDGDAAHSPDASDPDRVAARARSPDDGAASSSTHAPDDAVPQVSDAATTDAHAEDAERSGDASDEAAAADAKPPGSGPEAPDGTLAASTAETQALIQEVEELEREMADHQAEEAALEARRASAAERAAARASKWEDEPLPTIWVELTGKAFEGDIMDDYM